MNEKCGVRFVKKFLALPGWPRPWLRISVLFACLCIHAHAQSPTFSPPGGAFATSQQVTITAAGYTIHYTTDGSTPTLSSPVITSGSAITVDRFMTVNAGAWNGTTLVSSNSAAFKITGAIAAGSNHAIALKYDTNKLYSWGNNASGQLGIGNTNTVNGIQTVKYQGADLTGIVAISTGLNHNLVLNSSGSIYNWGDNSAGQLGNSTTTDKTNPIQPKKADAVTTLTNVIAIASGANFNLALDSNGSVWSWGAGGNGQLGNGVAAAQSYLAQVKTDASTSLRGATLADPVVSLACGNSHAIAITASHTAWGWGDNSHYELGLSTTGDKLYAKPLTAITGVSSAECGGAFTLFLTTGGNVKSLGLNTKGQLGNNLTDGVDQVNLQNVVDSNGVAITSIVQVAAGADFALALTSSGTVYAWGSNQYGTLGNGSVDGNKHAQAMLVMQAPGIPLANIVQIACGTDFCLALDSQGRIHAWGNSGSNVLGNDNSVILPSNVVYPVTYSTAPSVGNVPVSVTVVSPYPYQPFYAPSSVPLTANVSVQAGGPTISRVDYYYSGGSLIGSSTTSPYTVVTPPLYSGTYSVIAIATDSNGIQYTSPNVIFSVQPSTVSISVPSPSTIAESSASYSRFTLTRTSPTSLNDLVVNYSISGSATNGQDYNTLSGFDSHNYWLNCRWH